MELHAKLLHADGGDVNHKFSPGASEYRERSRSWYGDPSRVDTKGKDAERSLDLNGFRRFQAMPCGCFEDEAKYYLIKDFSDNRFARGLRRLRKRRDGVI
jgi:hypothetical protein